MDYFGLWTELNSDPLSRGYSGMTAASAATNLNLKNRTLPVTNVSLETINRWLFRTPAAITRLRAGQDDLGKTATVRGMCWSLMNLKDVPFDNVPTATGSAIADALLSASVLVQSERDDLISFGLQTISRATELSFETVAPGHVIKAKAQFGGG